MDTFLGQIAPSLREVGSTLGFILIASVVLEAVLYFVLGVLLKSKYTLAFMLVGPAAAGLLLLVVYPLIWEFNLSLTNMSLRHFGDKAEYTWQVGAAADPATIKNWLTDCLLKNYADVFRSPVLKQVYFLPVLLRTVLWTGANVFFHVAGGMGLA